VGTSTTTGKHAVEMTAAEQAAAIDRAKELAERFRPFSESSDQDRRFPLQTKQLYVDAGFASLAVPKRYGGQGADIWTTAQVGRELAKGDSSTALAYNMHQSMVGIFRDTPALDEDARARLMRSIVDEDLLLSGPFSEARAGLSGLADTTAVPTGDGGWRITGKKNWATLCEACDLVATNATITDEDGQLPTDHGERLSRESTFIVQSGLPGMSIEETWDTLGMRGSGSHTLVFDGVHATPDTYGGNFRTGLIGEAEWASVLFGGVYLGVAERAYAETVAVLRKKHTGVTAAGVDSAVRDSGSVQHELGRMYATIETASRAVETTARMLIEDRVPVDGVVARKGWYDVTKIATTEAAITATDIALRLVGGPAFRRGHVIERLFRDARAGVLHSYGTRQLYDALGAAALEA
jgi:alkylation response protein AidB-like acyl-CoA dehydrogenase